jgi:hypothetical protein
MRIDGLWPYLFKVLACGPVPALQDFLVTYNGMLFAYLLHTIDSVEEILLVQ